MLGIIKNVKWYKTDCGAAVVQAGQPRNKQ
jgi:hypothetical protein